MALAAITRVDGTRNIPGTKLKMKANWYDNITTFVGLNAAPTTEAERTTVTGTFVCALPFVEWEFIPASGGITGKKMGSHFKLEYEGELFIPNAASGLTAEDQIAHSINSRMIFVIGQQNGVDRLAGEIYDRPATIEEIDFTTKKVGEDGTVSVKVKLSWFSALAAGAKFTGTAPIV